MTRPVSGSEAGGDFWRGGVQWGAPGDATDDSTGDPGDVLEPIVSIFDLFLKYSSRLGFWMAGLAKSIYIRSIVNL